jgi:hypothetical protein
MTLGDRRIYSVLFIGSVRRERCDWVADLIEQRASSGGVINIFLGQLNRDNLTTTCIDAYMRLTP